MIFSVVALFIAVFVDFELYNKKGNTKKSKKSIVATGTMTLFFIIYYIIIRTKIGSIGFRNDFFDIMGTLFVGTGSIINIIGRFQLKENWSNHIKIYEGHSLVRHGVYKIVRHPLYASIMLMLFGGSIFYSNILSAFLTAFIFIPFMYYRAKQEEAFLIQEFAEYKNYKNNVGMFFPKIWR